MESMFALPLDVDTLNSDELQEVGAELAQKKQVMLEAYKASASTVQALLAARVKEEQKARRDANPEEYDRLHQGIGIGG